MRTIRETLVREEGDETYLDVWFESDDPNHVYGHTVPISAIGPRMVLLGLEDPAEVFDFILNEHETPTVHDWSPMLNKARSIALESDAEDVESLVDECTTGCRTVAPSQPVRLKRLETTPAPVASIRERLREGDLADLVKKSREDYAASLIPEQEREHD